MRKALMFFLVALLAATPLMAMAEGTGVLRGYDENQEQEYQFVQLGQYPYEADGTTAPVLWKVLDVRDGQMLLMTEYVIDTGRIIFEDDPEAAKENAPRRIGSFAESDLMPELNAACMDRLFGDDPIQNAMIPEGENGRLFILSKEQFMNAEYGFPPIEGDIQTARQAVGTPYAVRQRGLLVDGGNGKSPYWVSTVSGADENKMFLVDCDGRVSDGTYTRTDVGLRLSVRLRLDMILVTGGDGTKDAPFLIACFGPDAGAAQAVEPEAAIQTEQAPDQQSLEPEATAKKEGTITISLLGDCSIGDTAQNIDNTNSYHSTVDKNGYAWPFSLVSDYLKNDDLTVANLEAVLTNQRKHVDKRYYLKAEPDHVQILKEGGVDLVNTVNNHCMDFYVTGYEECLKTLTDAGVGHFGFTTGYHQVFDDLATAEANGIRVGFLGYSYPQEGDLDAIAERIRMLREEKKCDVVIVSLHWGRETHMTPEAWQFPFARKIIDAGADAVYGHHAHVIQPIQFYQGKPILYNTGNFTFGTISKLDPSTGIFQLTYERNDEGKVELRQLRVIPCNTQGSPDYRPIEVTDPAARQAIFKKLTLKKEYADCENPPASFLETGIVELKNGRIIR